MAQAIAYLGFNGDCAEAIRFYARVLGLGATVQQLLSGADTPMRDQIPPEHRHRILHARLRFDDGSYLFAGDAPAQLPYEGIKSVSIAMAESVRLLVPALSGWVWILFFGLTCTVTQVLLSHRLYVLVLKWLTLGLLSYFGVLAVVDVNWAQVAKAVIVPHWSFDAQFWLMRQ